jgi:predicted ferric reductase
VPNATRGVIWFSTYVAVVVVPLIFAAIGALDEDRGFWREFAVALGFVGLSMLGLQFVLVARLQTVAAPFGRTRWSTFTAIWVTRARFSSLPTRSC